ncbi:MAG: glycoside hydrolase family 2 TIM barrel-domain containing protein [Eubacteriales bacterium]
MNIQLLDGDDWILQGRLKNQMQKKISMEISMQIDPYVNAVNASVPGNVQLDLLKSGRIENPYYGRNSEKVEWVNNREWHYKKTFELSESLKCFERYILEFDGLDFCGEIYLNNIKISAFDDIFIPIKIDVTSKIVKDGTNTIDVVFRQSPEVDCMYGYTSRTKIFKPRFSYAWDWSPRMVTIGIWDSVKIKGYNYINIRDFYPKTDGNAVITQACVDTLLGGEYSFKYNIFYNNRISKTVVFDEILPASTNTVCHNIEIENPDIWQPNGSGNQPLYTVELEIKKNEKTCDCESKRVGFKTVEFIKNDNSPEGSLNYTAVINGKRTFLRGVNWVPLSMYYGAAVRNDYYNILKRFKDINCNILRVWAGGILEKKDFYDICDEMGLMIWQEFPQSSSGIDNLPFCDDPDVLEKFKLICSHYITRRRHHPSHIIWCGGNELMYDNYTPVDFRNRNIFMLKNLVEELDCGKKFLPCSASGPSFCASENNFNKGMHHDVHGPWKYCGADGHYSFFNGDDSLFRSETGSPGAERYSSLVKYSDGLPLWPPTNESLVWSYPSTWWVLYEDMKSMFGDFGSEEDLKRYIECTRYLQMESVRYSIEASRRREGEISGFIVWMGNEPFPNPCNTSIIEYEGGQPKPVYYALRNAYSNRFLSLKYDRILYKIGESFDASLYNHGCEGGEVEIVDGGGNLISTCLQFIIPVCTFDLFLVRLKLDGEINNTYIFNVGGEKPFSSLRNLPKASVTFEQKGKIVLIRNISDVPAISIMLYNDDYSAIYKNNITLLGGESISVDLEQDTEVYMEGYNL